MPLLHMKAFQQNTASYGVMRVTLIQLSLKMVIVTNVTYKRFLCSSFFALKGVFFVCVACASSKQNDLAII